VSTPLDKLAYNFARINASRKRQSKLFENGLTKKNDIRFQINGLFLIAMRQFEFFLEEHLVALAADEVKFAPRSIDGKRIAVQQINNEREPKNIQRLLNGGRSYVDFLPYDKSIRLAKVFLKKGYPFSLLPTTPKRQIEKCISIRNLVAHESIAARRSFKEKVLDVTPLPPYERNTAGYLMTDFDMTRTNFEADISNLLAAARFLS
jgi:hypothetical protein